MSLNRHEMVNRFTMNSGAVHQQAISTVANRPRSSRFISKSSRKIRLPSLLIICVAQQLN